jgi:hypothetical protein
MIKRVNFTGRRRLPRRCVEATVFEGLPRRFSATINLADYNFPSDAEVVLEATSAGSNVVERIPCGAAGSVKQPTNRALTEAEGENIFFTLKVIDRQQTLGRLLGLAEHIRPELAGAPVSGGRRGILPIEPANLKQELWRLEFKDQDVVLKVNKDVPGLKDRARSDPLFYAVVYPEVVRRVLAHCIDSGVEITEDEERWEVLWLRFGRDLHPIKESPPSQADPELDQEEWIEDVVEAFCENHQFKAKFQAHLLGSDEDQR